jgi:hypothetical protein
MKIITSVTGQGVENQVRQVCTTTFETSEGEIRNSYVCDQDHFTSAQMWNLLMQKKQVSRKG